MGMLQPTLTNSPKRWLTITCSLSMCACSLPVTFLSQYQDREHLTLSIVEYALSELGNWHPCFGSACAHFLKAGPKLGITSEWKSMCKPRETQKFVLFLEKVFASNIIISFMPRQFLNRTTSYLLILESCTTFNDGFAYRYVQKPVGQLICVLLVKGPHHAVKFGAVTLVRA